MKIKENNKTQIKELKEELKKIKTTIRLIRRMIYKNYGLLDKYEIEIIDDKLKEVLEK